jgi:hypothetical protein
LIGGRLCIIHGNYVKWHYFAIKTLWSAEVAEDYVIFLTTLYDIIF